MSNDRSVNLADLATRAQSGPAKRGRTECRNPECVNGMTPGLVAAGGGNKGQPLFGAGGVGAKRLMRWFWVNCLACNAPADAGKAGATYRSQDLSEGEIARRAQMANTKAPFVQEERETLRRSTPMSTGGLVTPTTSQSNKQLTELLEQNKQLNERLAEMLKQNVAMTDTLSRMSMQVAALLEDNANMRLELAKPVVPPPSAPT